MTIDIAKVGVPPVGWVDEGNPTYQRLESIIKDREIDR
jgi:hypothetical protein